MRVSGRDIDGKLARFCLIAVERTTVIIYYAKLEPRIIHRDEIVRRIICTGSTACSISYNR